MTIPHRQWATQVPPIATAPPRPRWACHPWAAVKATIPTNTRLDTQILINKPPINITNTSPQATGPFHLNLHQCRPGLWNPRSLQGKDPGKLFHWFKRLTHQTLDWKAHTTAWSRGVKAASLVPPTLNAISPPFTFPTRSTAPNQVVVAREIMASPHNDKTISTSTGARFTEATSRSASTPKRVVVLLNFVPDTRSPKS